MWLMFCSMIVPDDMFEPTRTASIRIYERIIASVVVTLCITYQILYLMFIVLIIPQKKYGLLWKRKTQRKTQVHDLQNIVLKSLLRNVQCLNDDAFHEYQNQRGSVCPRYLTWK